MVVSRHVVFMVIFGQGDIRKVEKQLIGVRVVKADLFEALSKMDIPYYFGKTSAEELVDLILS